MFYPAKNINDLLICDLCKRKYDDPRIVPCGETFCNKCINASANKDSCFNCNCEEKRHPIPGHGFMKNKKILHLLEAPNYDLYRGEKIEELKSKINMAKNEIEKLENGLKNSEFRFRDYCVSVRSEIDLATEKAIDAIQNNRDELLNQVNEYEKEIMDKIKRNHLKYCRDQLEKSLKGTKRFYDQWNNSIENITSDKDANSAIEDFVWNLNEPKKNESLLNIHMYQNKKMRLSLNETQINPSAIVKLEFENLTGYIDFENITKIGLEKLDFIKNKDGSYIMDFGLLENGNILCCYAQDSRTVCFCEIDKNKNILKSIPKNYKILSELQIDFIKFYTKYNKLVLQIKYNNKKSLLLDLDINDFNALNKFEFGSDLTDFDFSSENVYCLVNGNKKMCFNFDFSLINNFNLTGSFTQIIINDVYTFYNDNNEFLSFYSRKTGYLEGDFEEIETDLLSICNDSLIVFYDASTRILSYKATDGEVEYEQKVPDEINPSVMKWNKNKYIIYDRENNCVYL